MPSNPRLSRLIAVLAVLVPLLASGPAAAKPIQAAKPYRVVTTVGMITDIVGEIAGEYAVVEGLIGEGIDPHLYQPTRGDVVKLMKADVVFYSGLMLEGKMADILERVGRRGRPIHAVTDGISESYVLGGAAGHHDPHVWMDVRGWMKAVENVHAALVAFDPAHQADYDANRTRYLEELKRLDAYAKKVLGSIPVEQRVLVTAHDAFSYLGRAYDVDVRGIQGISTESEAGVRDINQLVGFLVERKIAAVFVETSVADKNVRALVEGAADRGHVVRIGGELYSDAMGPASRYEGTYIGMIDHNVTIIARALGGTAPERGMQGKLTVEDHGDDH